MLNADNSTSSHITKELWLPPTDTNLISVLCILAKIDGTKLQAMLQPEGFINSIFLFSRIFAKTQSIEKIWPTSVSVSLVHNKKGWRKVIVAMWPKIMELDECFGLIVMHHY